MRIRDDVARREPRQTRRERAVPAREPAPDLASLSPEMLNRLQRASGNAAVCRALDRVAGPVHGSSAPAAPAREAKVVHKHEFTATIAMGDGPESRAPEVGGLTSSDAKPGGEKHMEPADVAAVLTEPELPPEPAATEAAGSSGGEPAEAAPEEEYELPDIILPELEGGLEGTDAVSSFLWTSGHITRGGLALGATEFGRTDGGDLRVTKIKVQKIPMMKRFLVRATIEHHIKWDVRAGAGPTGEVDINGWSSPNITAANYKDVADDLTPDTSDLGGRPPRNAFWAQDLTEQHEEFHADDMVKHTDPAASLASTWLSAQLAPNVAGVNALLTAVPGKMVTAIIASYIPRAEHRAYGDGLLAYRTRALAIRARGKLGGY